MGLVLRLDDGRRMERDGREWFWLYPKTSVGGYSIYALGFRNGRTKIGTCFSPRTRFVAHWVNSEGAVTWSHLFGERFFDRPTVLRIERAAINRASLIGSRIRRTETFNELSRDDAIRCVRAAIAEARAEVDQST